MFEKCNSYNTLIKSIPIINEIYKVINTIITLLWLCLCLSGVFYFTWKVVPRLCNFAPYSFSEMILLFGLFLFNIIFFYFVVKTFVNSVSPLFFKKMIFSKGLCKALFLQIT